MAALNAVSVDCPTCGQTINVPITAVAGAPDGTMLPVTITPDLTPISAHAAEHQEA